MAWLQVVSQTCCECGWPEWGVSARGLKSGLMCKWADEGGGVGTTFRGMRDLLSGTWLATLMGGRGWISALLPGEKNWRPRPSLHGWINQGSNDTAGWGAHTVTPMGLLTALQGLFPSRKHSAGEHACGRQAFQRQHTLTLFSAKTQPRGAFTFHFL